MKVKNVPITKSKSKVRIEEKIEKAAAEYCQAQHSWG